MPARIPPDPRTAEVVASVVALVSRLEGVDPSLMLSSKRPKRSPRVDRARHLAAYVCHVVLGLRTREVADAMGKTPCVLVTSYGIIEDMRDDPAFDEYVSSIERQLQMEDA